MRYFFHMRSSRRFVEDPEGVELPDLAAVRREAALDARTLVAERIKAGDRIEIDSAIEVADETGAVVHTIALAVIILASLAAIPAELSGL